jgi:uncharacterized protein YraI
MLISAVVISLGVQAQEFTATTASPLNVRTEPNGNILGQIPKNAEVVVEGRNGVGDWVLVHTRDGSLRGWVALQYLNRTFLIEQIAVSGEVITAAPPPSQPETQPESQPVAVDPGVSSGVTTGQLNLRAAPNTGGEVISELAPQTTLIIDGRNQIGDWLAVHTPDNALSGWVASRYVALNGGLILQNLPISGSPAMQTGPIVEPNVDLSGAIVLPANVIQNARAILAEGIVLGNRRNVFTTVGDSITTEQPFLKGFTYSPYDLGVYGYLQDTINFFSVPPRDGEPTSFAHHSMAASPAFTTGATLDVAWRDTSLCGAEEAPLLCEYRVIKPSVAIIMLGSIDVRFFEGVTFRDYLERVLELTIDQGVIPVLTTFPNGDTYYPEKSALFNDIIRSVAAEQSLPLIELRSPLMALPNRGVGDDQFHLSQDGEAYIFNGNETHVGVTMRNFLTLQMLDALRRNVLQ